MTDRETYIPGPPEGCKKLALTTVALLALLLVALVDVTIARGANHGSDGLVDGGAVADGVDGAGDTGAGG